MDETEAEKTAQKPEEKGHPVVAALLDAAMWPLRKARREVVPEARGHVLEIGVGTGGNLPHYEDVHSLTGIDPDPHMLRRARHRAEKVAPFAELLEQRAEALPFSNNTFDTVVATWVLCTIPDPERALAEMHRVLRPGGTLIFAEHTLSRFSGAARLQRRVTPFWAKIAAGCHLDRDSIAMIEAAGFRDVRAQPGGGERFTLAPVYLGTARA